MFKIDLRWLGFAFIPNDDEDLDDKDLPYLKGFLSRTLGCDPEAVGGAETCLFVGGALWCTASTWCEL